MSLKQDSVHKKLSQERDRLKSERDSLRGRISSLQKQSGAISERIKMINCDIYKIEQKSDGLRVSDHAIVRYVERVLGVDTEDICKEIIDKVDVMHNQLGNGKYPIGHGSKAVINQGVIVTITGEDK